MTLFNLYLKSNIKLCMPKLKSFLYYFNIVVNVKNCFNFFCSFSELSQYIWKLKIYFLHVKPSRITISTLFQIFFPAGIILSSHTQFIRVSHVFDSEYSRVCKVLLDVAQKCKKCKLIYTFHRPRNGSYLEFG